MAHNIQTMAYVGDVPWHGLWKAVTKGIHADELIVAAGEAAGARLDRVWFGAGAGLKLKALTAAAEIARLN